ncbi:MAG: YqgE/AlgH family protein [Planctomycetaceae bacterium]
MEKSLQGQFLIATCGLRDSHFFKTAVLIVEHGKDGAMGLVINRPSSVTVSNALGGQFDLPDIDDLVYVGGPVEPAALFVLHGDPNLCGEESPVVPGLFIATNAEVFEEVLSAVAEGDHNFPCRLYSGCAGWAPGQLEGEIDRGDWLALPASPELVFHDDPYAVWDNLLQAAYRSHRLLPDECDHPEWN